MLGTGQTARVAYWALAWVIVFLAFHVYWYAGGSFGHPGSLPGAPHTVAGWVFQVLVVAAFPLGAGVTLAIARGWGLGRLRRAAVIVVGLAFVVLTLRGGAGVVDELTRVTGLLPNGLTGLSREAITGSAHPSADVLWSGRATDAYFLAGGILFGVLAHRFARARSVRPLRSPRPGRAWATR
jgi:uncharacterized membrane protein (Fun14 family)